MRCPKCGDSFQVNAPGAEKESLRPVLGAALGLSRAETTTPPARKATMLGVAASGEEAAIPPPPKRPPPRQTMLGVAPAASGFELANLDDDAVKSEDEGIELELSGPDSDEAALPMPASKKGGAATIDLPSISPDSASGNSIAPDSEEFDLEAASLPDLAVAKRGGGPSRLESDLPDLDLPSPRAPRPKVNTLPEEADLPDIGADLPDLGGDLPDLGGDLPDLEAGLPDLDIGGAGLPAMDLVGFHQTSERGLPAPAEQLPDLGKPPQPPVRRRTSDSDLGNSPFGSPQELSNLGESDPFASPTEVGGITRSSDPGGFGEVGLDSEEPPSFNEADEFDAFPTEEKPARDTSGGAAGYGDVALDGEGGDLSGGGLDLGDEIDRGQAPAGGQRGPVAAASAKVDLSGPARPEKYSDSRDKKKKKRATSSSMSKGTKIAVLSVLGLAVAGGALASLLPDVGPYGAYFILDQVKASEYQRDFERDIKDAQKKMNLDSSGEIGRAFQLMNMGLTDAPRFKARAAYAAYIGFFHQLRFGASSDESAQAHALLETLREADPKTPYLELAQLTLKAAAGHPEVPADQANRLVGRGIEYAVLVGESALLKGKAEVAESVWTKILAQEDSARSHFGMARTRHLLGQLDEVKKELAAALAKNDKHAGARILEAKLLLRDRSLDDKISEALLPISQGQVGASRGEQVDALTVLGELHLLRARLKKAEEAFSSALAKNAGSAPAQRGLAQVLFESGRYSEALARYESALSVEPGDLSTSLGIVQCKLQLEQLDDAVKLLDSLNPKHPGSSALQYWLATAKEAIGDKAGAHQAFSKAIELNENVPELVLAHVALTRLLSQTGEHLAASKVIDDAEEKFPNDPAVFEALGELAASRGSFDDAVAHFDKAIQLDPKNIGLHFSRGIALRQARRFDEAAAEFDRVEKDSVDYPGLALERGNLFEASGRSEEALAAYEKALAAAPDDLDLKLRVACGKASAGQSKEVIKQLELLLEARPSSAEVNFCQGLALLNGEDFTQAKIFLERAVSRDPSRAKHHLYVGWVNLEMGEFASANRALDQTIKLDSTLADAYWKRGELRVKQRAVQDALSDLDKALELAPSRTEAHAQKALAYLELGKEQEAMAEFQIAVSAPVVEPAWHYRYGDLLLANRRPAEARTQLEQAITKVKGLDQPPVWAVNAHRLLALAIGRKKEALEHWQVYVNAKKGTSDPYLGDAAREMDAILRSLGH